jgi:hypothetical protein
VTRNLAGLTGRAGFAAVALCALTLSPAAAALKAEASANTAEISEASELALPYQPLEGFSTADELTNLAAARVIQWISTSNDNGNLPFIVIDKHSATMFLFDAKSNALGDTPVLIGIAAGDDSSPGVGSKKLSEIGPAERTTPAGRFLARYGYAAGGERVLWVKYADSVAMHAVVTSNRREQRRLRLLTPDAEDNRITFGCINVPESFYQQKVRPLFEKEGGMVYILPDTKPLEEVFPRLLMHSFASADPS